MEWIKQNRLGVIVVAGIGVILLLGLLATNQQEKSNTDELLRQENARIKVVESALRVYYVETGSYPTSYQELSDYESLKEEKSILEAVSKQIKGFAYEHRGDYQAYTLNYESLTGEKKTVTGEYRADYQE